MATSHHDHGGTESLSTATSSASVSSLAHHETSFYWGQQATILFEGWRTTSPATYIASLLALLLISFLYQYLERLTSSSSPLLSQFHCCPPASQGSHNNASKPFAPAPHVLSLPTKLFLTLLFGLRVGLAYLLMLAVMSFNGGIFLAIILGFSAGFFAFRTDIHAPKCAPEYSSSDANPHPAYSSS
ncbi:hypothetical protein L7F22_030123 [Adiantum nelumboides]|nr:hypothetical protein [Adiantum nelumboides]